MQASSLPALAGSQSALSGALATVHQLENHSASADWRKAGVFARADSQGCVADDLDAGRETQRHPGLADV